MSIYISDNQEIILYEHANTEQQTFMAAHSSEKDQISDQTRWPCIMKIHHRTSFQQKYLSPTNQ